MRFLNRLTYLFHLPVSIGWLETEISYFTEIYIDSARNLREFFKDSKTLLPYFIQLRQFYISGNFRHTLLSYDKSENSFMHILKDSTKGCKIYIKLTSTLRPTANVQQKIMDRCKCFKNAYIQFVGETWERAANFYRLTLILCVFAVHQEPGQKKKEV